MKILVTGSAGFIGMHLCKRLLAEGHVVHGIDNFNAYYSVELKRARHAELAGHPRFTADEADISHLDAVTDAFRHFQPEVVCNLAAQPGVRYSIDHPHVYAQANVVGFLNILEACRHHGVRRLVYASSSSVYGGNTKLPFSETDPVDHPVSLYAATKKANELMAHTYTHLYGLQTIGLRFFTVYGPWGRPDMAVWSFTKAMLAGRPIPVYNRGEMRRDFTYIDDIVTGVAACIRHEGLEPCEIFNIGNHRPEPLMELIRILGVALGVEPRLELLPMQPGDMPATYSDIGRIRAKLGFEPTTPIALGIPAFVAWYRTHGRLG